MLHDLCSKIVATTFLLFMIAVGAMAQNNTSYSANTVSITGSQNTAFGVGALSLNSSGNNNTANGFDALSSNLSGNQNTANGTYALYYNITGGQNTANGWGSLIFNTTGNQNTANGFHALYYNTTGNTNTADGYYALLLNKSGSNNVALGDSAGYNSLGNDNIYLGQRAGYFETGNNKLYIGNDSDKTIIYGDLSTGKILLGNKNPAGYTFKGNHILNVLGGIITDSIYVALSSNWADYVFDNNYQLKSISELDEFIHANKHLPGIPSSKEVAANGIELGTMDTNLLQKIEELTLYLVQQQKQIEEQKQENKSLQQQIDELKKLIMKNN